jgi:hypothetical protein
MLDKLMASVSCLPNTTYDSPAFDLSSTDGFVIKGEPWNDYRGHLISSAGDINGDGLDDLIIGVYEANPTTYDLPAFDLSFGLAS